MAASSGHPFDDLVCDQGPCAILNGSQFHIFGQGVQSQMYRCLPAAAAYHHGTDLIESAAEIRDLHQQVFPGHYHDLLDRSAVLECLNSP